MLTDREFEKLFKEKKYEIPDQGFSNEVMYCLPEKINVLPQIIIILFALIGLSLYVVLQGVSIFESFNHICLVNNSLEGLSFSVVTPYISSIIITCSIGYALYQADIG